MKTPRTPTKAQSRPDASMALLRDVTEQSLDVGYAEAAARREAGENAATPPRVAVRTVLVLLLAVATGLGGVWAARELRAPPAGVSARQVLIDQIRERSDVGAELVEQNTALRAEIQDLQRERFGDSAAAAVDEATRLGIWNGTTPVSGPGVVISMEDSARAQAGEPDAEDERVLDRDLQLVVNALWASGAESIAINGIRLTNATAIRSAGSVVLVDLEPVVSPYKIEAIGNPDDVRTSFARTQGAEYLSWLNAEHGITSQMATADDLYLPAGTTPSLEALATNQRQ